MFARVNWLFRKVHFPIFKNSTFCILALLLLFVGCRPLDSGNLYPPFDEIRGDWLVVGSIKEGVAYPPDSPYQQFHVSQSMITGSTGCNQFGLKWEETHQSGFSLTKWPDTKIYTQTVVLCSRIIDLETREKEAVTEIVGDVISKVERYELRDGQLHLFDDQAMQNAIILKRQ